MLENTKAIRNYKLYGDLITKLPKHFCFSNTLSIPVRSPWVGSGSGRGSARFGKRFLVKIGETEYGANGGAGRGGVIKGRKMVKRSVKYAKYRT